MSTNTETPSRHHELDLYDTLQLVSAFTEDQVLAALVVHRNAPLIAKAVDAAWPRIANGGRLIYAGAGTSGRLGLMDSVELRPTFAWPRERAVALLAGGDGAMFAAVEGAEDNRELGRRDVESLRPGPNDVLIGIAASGFTPYVLGAIAGAKAVGALVIGIANNPAAPVTLEADIGITLDTGSEVISGSTRLKAGTSQKAVLNTLSSAIMVRLHKVHGNLMVDVMATNAKLMKRAVSLTAHITGCSEIEAQNALSACDYRVKVAATMIVHHVDAAEASRRLDAAGGCLRVALGSSAMAHAGTTVS